MSLAGQVSSLAVRIGAEFKSVRTALDAKAPVVDPTFTSGLTINGTRLHFSGTVRAALLTEASNSLINFGTNFFQAGGRDATKRGAYFRIDTRDSNVGELFSVTTQEPGVSDGNANGESKILQLSNTGNLAIAASTPVNVNHLTRKDYVDGQVATRAPLSHTHSKSEVGLANVDNTSDAAKPVSSATQSALNAKENTLAAGTTAQYYRGDKTWQTLDKSSVGLGNVDNTTDANKPVSTAMQSALNLKADQSALANKADLVGGFISTSQIPALALNTVVPVASQAAMLALTAAQVQPGDVASRSDGAGTFMLTAADPSVLANWTLLNAPTDKVVSVNGQVGTVTLVKADVGLSLVDNTSDLGKPISTATQTALNAKEGTIAAGTTAQYWRGDKTWQTLNKAAVGLSLVDNTADTAKPVSTAQQSAIDLKENTLVAGTASQYYRGDKTWQTLNAAAVGLANVTNTSDANKPVSTAQQTALNAKADLVGGVVPASQLPATAKSFTITTVVNTNASSIAGGTAEASAPSSLFTYLGARASDLLNVQNSGGYGSRWKNGGTSTSFPTAPWGIQFRPSKTRYVELMVAPVGTDASMRIFVNGVEDQLVPRTFPSFQQNVFNTVKIDLGPEPRLVAPVIRVDFSSTMLFGKVWVEAGGHISPVTERGKRYVFEGDSLMQGETQNTGGDLGSYVGYMSRYLGSADVWNAGVRGSGPNTSSGNGGNYITRASTDVANTAADVVVIGGFFNDRAAGRTPAQVAADFATTADTILAMASKPVIIAMGSPDPTGGSNATEWATFDSAIQAAMQARGIAYVSQSTGAVTFGNGTVITTQGPWIAPGTMSWMLGSDNLHPTDVGHQYMAARMWEAMSLILSQPDNRDVSRVTADNRYLAKNNPVATGLLTAPQAKFTTGAVSGRYARSTADGTLVWSSPPSLYDTLANWTTNAASVYQAGVLLIESDTRRIKVGDGTSAWSALKYVNIQRYASEVIINSGALADNYNDNIGGVLVDNDIVLEQMSFRIADPAENVGGTGNLQIQWYAGSTTATETTLIQTTQIAAGQHDVIVTLATPLALTINTVLRAKITRGTTTVTSPCHIQWRGRYAL